MDNRRKQENHPGGGFFASAETVSIGPVESSKVWSSPTFTKILKKGQYCFYTDIFNRPFFKPESGYIGNKMWKTHWPPKIVGKLVEYITTNILEEWNVNGYPERFILSRALEVSR